MTYKKFLGYLSDKRFDNEQVKVLIKYLQDDDVKITRVVYDGMDIKQPPFDPMLSTEGAHIFGRTPKNEKFNVFFINCKNSSVSNKSLVRDNLMIRGKVPEEYYSRLEKILDESSIVEGINLRCEDTSIVYKNFRKSHQEWISNDGIQRFIYQIQNDGVITTLLTVDSSHFDRPPFYIHKLFLQPMNVNIYGWTPENGILHVEFINWIIYGSGDRVINSGLTVNLSAPEKYSSRLKKILDDVFSGKVCNVNQEPRKKISSEDVETRKTREKYDSIRKKVYQKVHTVIHGEDLDYALEVYLWIINLVKTEYPANSGFTRISHTRKRLNNQLRCLESNFSEIAQYKHLRLNQYSNSNEGKSK